LLGDWSGFTGKINVTTDSDGGTLVLGNNEGYTSATINLNDKVTAIYRYTSNDTIDIGELNGTSGSALGAGGEGSAIITWRIGSRNTNSTFEGIIKDVQYKNSGAKASIIKTGSGTWTLTNENTYTGNTLVEEGLLLINNTSGSGTGTGPVTVMNSASLSGNGSVAGDVTVTEGGFLSINKSEIGIFTIDNDVTLLPGSYLCIDADPAGKTSDKLVAKGKLKPGGILYMARNGTTSYSAGDSFKIFEASSCSGKFELIIPLTPGGGLLWDTTGLYSTGVIHVVKSTGIINSEIRDQIIQIYPNPATRQINVHIEGINLPAYSDNISLRCYNDQGKMCHQEWLSISGNRSTAEIDVSHLDPGTYIIVITIDGCSYTEKFIKN
jgi:autotransporter-associated beta strand protein